MTFDDFKKLVTLNEETIDWPSNNRHRVFETHWDLALAPIVKENLNKSLEPFDLIDWNFTLFDDSRSIGHWVDFEPNKPKSIPKVEITCLTRKSIPDVKFLEIIYQVLSKSSQGELV